MSAKTEKKKDISLLDTFIKEFNDYYYSNLYKDTSSDIFSEIRHVEKIMTNPKFHPTNELKNYYKQIRENYASPFRTMLVGGNDMAKIIFINVLLKDSILPLNNLLAQKRIVVKYSTHKFVIAHCKNYSMSINLHTFEFSGANLEEIDYFEIFINDEILKNIEIVKPSDGFDKKSLGSLKDIDLILWIFELNSKINKDSLAKILKKKQVITLLTHINKEIEEGELLEQISNTKNYIDETFGLNEVYEIDLWNLFYGYRLDERAMLQKSFGLLSKQITSKNRNLDTVVSMLDGLKTNVESFFNEREDYTLDKIQQDKLNKISESMQKSLQNARVSRGMSLLKDALDKNRVIDSHYKMLFAHYKLLDNEYHKATLMLCSRALKLHAEYNKEAFISISKSIKKYLDSMVDSILDSMETIKISTRPSNPSFLDNITNKKIVYEGYQINQDELLRELDDSQSLLARKHKNLLTKISRFVSYVSQNIDDSLESFNYVLKEWISKGHHLVLQKKPPFVSMDRYLSLEEFNLGIYDTFTKQHNEIMRDFNDKVKTSLSALNVWVQATRKVLLECVISRLEKKLLHDKHLAKIGKAGEIKKIDRDLIVDTILELLPSEIHRLFCELPGARNEFENIPMLLSSVSKENEKLIRYRIREIMDLRQSAKVATKILDAVLSANAKND